MIRVSSRVASAPWVKEVARNVPTCALKKLNVTDVQD